MTGERTLGELLIWSRGWSDWVHGGQAESGGWEPISSWERWESPEGLHHSRKDGEVRVTVRREPRGQLLPVGVLAGGTGTILGFCCGRWADGGALRLMRTPGWRCTVGRRKGA